MHFSCAVRCSSGALAKGSARLAVEAGGLLTWAGEPGSAEPLVTPINAYPKMKRRVSQNIEAKHSNTNSEGKKVL